MPFVSELMGRKVTDVDGNTIGTLVDLLATQANIPVPKIVAIKIKRNNGSAVVPISEVAALFAPIIPLNHHQDTLPGYIEKEDDLVLVEDVLDKQIIDTNGVRVVRVNDLEITRIEGEFYVSNVDIGGAGLLRRLGFKRTPVAVPDKAVGALPSGMISWEDVELITHDEPLRLKVPSDKLSVLHPADLAEILSDLNRQEGGKLLESLDDETLADTLEEVEPDFQASLVEQLPDERIADVLEEMSPDEAADLLAELPEDRSEQLLNLMEKDEAEDVRKLLTFPEESAGGIMNTEFVSLPVDLTAGQAITRIRETANDAETIYYIYVTDEAEHLLGVFSLRQLVLANPKNLIKNFMETHLITVDLTDDQDRCAQIISKYNLLAVPVVDKNNVIHGIVTADDALDKIIPTAWKKRLPKLYH
jgi:flagellar motility protein MotE (MotC chaperone)/sporulation protein YlmC with PRC-barrel domain